MLYFVQNGYNDRINEKTYDSKGHKLAFIQ